VADYAVTPANVKASAGASVEQRTCGEAGGLVAGDAVYLDANDPDADGVGKAKKADANAGVGQAAVDGICLHAASLGQPVLVCGADPDFTPGAALSATPRRRPSWPWTAPRPAS
jgi:hypothetical protein